VSYFYYFNRFFFKREYTNEMFRLDMYSETTPEGTKEVRLDQILLNGNNICLVIFFFFSEMKTSIQVSLITLLYLLLHNKSKLVPGGLPDESGPHQQR